MHNLEFLDRRGGSPLTPDAKGKIIRRAEIDVLTFTPPGPGTYYFQCVVHPSQMFGEFIVR